MGISCEISLCPQAHGKNEYRPGSLLTGAIKYNLDKDYDLKAIVVSLRGRARLYFEDKHEKTNHMQHSYTNEEFYVNIENVIHKNTGKPLPAGEYETPFSFQLPHDIPSSIIYMKNAPGYYCRCNIHYFLRIRFEKLGLLKMDDSFSKEINIVSGQTPRMATEPLIYGEQKNVMQLTSLFTGQKTIISLKATIANSVLRPGETVKVDYEVENDTDIDIKRVKVVILEVDHLVSAGGRKVHVKSEVENTEFTHGSINARGTAAFTAEIVVPSLCASFDHSKIFGRDYAVLATVVLPLPHINLNLEIPFQVIDRLTFNFEEGTDAAVGLGHDSEAPPSYWEAMKEVKIDPRNQGPTPSFMEKKEEKKPE